MPMDDGPVGVERLILELLDGRQDRLGGVLDEEVVDRVVGLIPRRDLGLLLVPSQTKCVRGVPLRSSLDLCRVVCIRLRRRDVRSRPKRRRRSLPVMYGRVGLER